MRPYSRTKLRKRPNTLREEKPRAKKGATMEWHHHDKPEPEHHAETAPIKAQSESKAAPQPASGIAPAAVPLFTMTPDDLAELARNRFFLLGGGGGV